MKNFILVKSFKNNFKSESILFTTQILIQLLFAPLMLLFWNKENFNLWILFFSIPSLVSVLNLNLTESVRNQMSIMFERKNLLNLNKIYSNLIFSFFYICLFMIIAFIFLLKSNQILLDNINVLVMIFSSSILIILNGVNYCKFTFRGDIKKWNLYSISYKAISLISLSISGYFFDDLFFGSLIYFFLTLIYFIICSNFKDKILVFNFNELDKFTILKIFNKSIQFNILNISSILKHSGLIFILGLLNQLTIIGTISTAKTLFYFFIIRFLDVITKPLSFEFTKNFSNPKINQKLLTNVRSILYSCTIIILFVCLILFFIGENIYNFWLNYNYVINKYLIFLIVADAFFYSVGNIFLLPFKAINKFLPISMFEICINLIILISIYFFINNNIIEIYEIILISSILIFFFKIFYFIFFFKRKILSDK